MKRNIQRRETDSYLQVEAQIHSTLFNFTCKSEQQSPRGLHVVKTTETSTNRQPPVSKQQWGTKNSLLTGRPNDRARGGSVTAEQLVHKTAEAT